LPEGRNLFDIATAAEQIGLFPAAQFLQAARDPAMIRDLDPHAPTLEGYLFPDTYKLSRKTTPERLCRIMTGKFRDVWKNLRTTESVHHTITLASLVEKEGKLAAERPQIAAVFANRLKRGMKLDCDPTTIYARCWRGGIAGRSIAPIWTAITRTTRTAMRGCRRGRCESGRGLDPRGARSGGFGFAVFSCCGRMAQAGTSFQVRWPAHDSAVGKYRPCQPPVAAERHRSSSGCASNLEAHPPNRITEVVWQALLLHLAPVSESYLRTCFAPRDCRFDQPYAGVRQHTLEELEESLRAMLSVYQDATASGNRDRARYWPPPGDRGQGPCEIHDAESAGARRATGAEGRNGAVDAGVAGESRSVPGLGGRAEASTGKLRGLEVSGLDDR
jgi:hypothetical protein